ncbi:hypothetical protein MKW98_015094 [Papaver atlanticum]|uniref:Macro domain-containing protein n=1 Tax=Papaver atlanticum TaxID=357466 RepID=A0AAD4S7B9_9MAGN|nr:hypothetical protein MKW98_015094 [Papaver atlanticum]
MASNSGESRGTVNDGSKVFKISSSSSLKIRRGDITKWAINGSSDAIVNAANERMLGGGGVDGGFKFPVSHVIHTVGPIYEIQSPRKYSALNCVVCHFLFSYPYEEAAKIVISTVHFVLQT